MLKFPSIDSFRHAVATVKRACDYHNLPLPKVTYIGTVKLHGTNAGIEIDFANKTLTPQSRERVLTVEQDNAGFARWVADNFDSLYAYFEALFEFASAGSKVTVYGEWIGPGIQKNVAINQLPNKMFVLCFVTFHDSIVEGDDASTTSIMYPLSQGWTGSVSIQKPEGVATVGDVEMPEIVVDFAQPDLAVAELEKYTNQFEEKCPFAASYGIEGIGEGLVWIPVVFGVPTSMLPENMYHRLWFKTKGEKHGNKATNNTVKVAVTAEKVEDFNALIAQILPDWRLEQGVVKILETRDALTIEQTGEYIKWVVSDVHKEELDTVEASEFEWKVVASELSKRARTWFLNRVRL